MEKELFPELINFASPYFNTQLITCIGNKRHLLPFINRGIETVKNKLSKKQMVTLDGFSGSGAVSRLLKCHSSQLWANDLEDYSQILNECYLSNKSQIDIDFIKATIQWLNENKLNNPNGKIGFIERNYAPKDDQNIQSGERVFYTNRNSKIIDNIKKLIIKNVHPKNRHFFLAPLIVKASIHVNTSGVFKGFHKKNGIGWFGGNGENALTRIKKEISLPMPIFSQVECQVHVQKTDVNKLVKSDKIPKTFDLAYYDPPYNQHPYGSNYFMLNLIANNKDKFEIQNGISGIVQNWNRSAYNKRQQANFAMDDLIANTPAKYILISYNDEGIIPINDFKSIIEKHGTVDLMTQEYNTYRGSRNLRQRNIKVHELLWLLKKT